MEIDNFITIFMGNDKYQYANNLQKLILSRGENEMVIPETQLEKWSHQGAVSSSKYTHESIRNALDKNMGYPGNIKYDVYLQGSYKNDTNIRGDSDVDLVVELKSSFYREISSLSPDEQSSYLSYFKDATYTWENFRSDILKAMQEYYGLDVIKEGRKSLKVGNPKGGRLPADVVVSMEYRKYLRFINSDNQKFIEGISFYVPSENRWVISYPKHHYENSVQKNSQSATNGWYKPLVRIFKNARTYLFENNKISRDLASSYFLEALIYNVPNDKFGTNFQTTTFNILYWLNNVEYGKFVCPNGQVYLFGSTPDQWTEIEARKLISSLIELWNKW
jgi:hypothetical protein